MKLTDKAYSSLLLLRRASFLMEGLENAEDKDILKVCKEIVKYLKEKGV